MTIETEIRKIVKEEIENYFQQMKQMELPLEEPKTEKPKAKKTEPKPDNVEKLNAHTIEDCQKLAREKMQQGKDKKDVKAAIDPDGRTLAALSEDEIQAAFLRIKAL